MAEIIPKETTLQALNIIIQLHSEKILEKKRVTQSSRLQRRHCWVLITLLSLAFQSVRGAEGEADSLAHGGGGSGFASGGANQSGTNESSSTGDGVREFFSRWTRH
ncbi:hypothetical protein CK203_113095 [Vitis vinifera]|uniref:Uncharacterized protein n=1 Tax=Vitis vinifera TaxID=29760 RepID=A0A438FDD5_VITVI|nr:hypothetical protein CK203_113095 [Vitis vinifera]